MRVALAKRPEAERKAPEGLVRQGDDWIYAEYADSTEFKTIDVPAAPEAAPTEAPPPPQ